MIPNLTVFDNFQRHILCSLYMGESQSTKQQCCQ